MHFRLCSILLSMLKLLAPLSAFDVDIPRVCVIFVICIHYISPWYCFVGLLYMNVDREPISISINCQVFCCKLLLSTVLFCPSYNLVLMLLGLIPLRCNRYWLHCHFHTEPRCNRYWLHCRFHTEPPVLFPVDHCSHAVGDEIVIDRLTVWLPLSGSPVRTT